jgi:N-acetylglucosaminyl-diphospho-decaprenol L-rhamnosyltransferase
MTHPEPAAVDAVIVAWNSAPDLPACLNALPPIVRAIVVDNGSRDGSVELARHHGATVLELGRNRGFPAAVNLGVELVTAPVTLILNPDVVVQEGTVERCLDVLLGDPSIGIVGPNTVTAAGEPEPPAARRDRRASHILFETLGLTRLHPVFERQTIRRRSSDRDVDAVNGAFMLMRTDLLRRLGGLDESVFMYLEDGDLCRRVRDAGSRVRFVADATAVHAGGTSTARGDLEAQARAYLHRLDADIEFLRRYGRRGEAGLAVAAFLLRAVVGLLVSTRLKERRLRYRTALRWTWDQRHGRRPPPVV